MTVVDASAVLHIISRSERGLEFETHLAGHEWHAPELIDLEVLNTLRAWVLARTATVHEAEQMLEVFLATPITRHPHKPLLPQVWELRHNLTAYDASYLALAEALGAPLITADAGLKKAASRRLH